MLHQIVSLDLDYAYIEKESKAIDLIINGESRFNINTMRKNLGDSLFFNVGVFKNETTLMKALDYTHYLFRHSFGLNCVNKEVHNNVELASILEFKNALTIAEAMILSALSRKESRGVHFREDYPFKDDKHFNKPSYVRALSHDLFQISFENNTIANNWYKLKKMLHIS
jgi:succinate dehydrogenase/fumarate reductase flavoprotein subunit